MKFRLETEKTNNFHDIIDYIYLENGAQPPKSKHIYQKNDGYVRFIQNRDYDSDSHLTYIPISSKNHLCDEKDIMMDKYGEAGVIRYGIAGAFNVALLKIKTKNDYMKEYIRDFLSQENISKILYTSSQASTRPSLNKNVFVGLNIPMVDRTELEKYQKTMNNVLEYELFIKRKIIKLKEMKTILLKKYF